VLRPGHDHDDERFAPHSEVREAGYDGVLALRLLDGACEFVKNSSMSALPRLAVPAYRLRPGVGMPHHVPWRFFSHPRRMALPARRSEPRAARRHA